MHSHLKREKIRVNYYLIYKILFVNKQPKVGAENDQKHFKRISDYVVEIFRGQRGLKYFSFTTT